MKFGKKERWRVSNYLLIGIVFISASYFIWRAGRADTAWCFLLVGLGLALLGYNLSRF